MIRTRTPEALKDLDRPLEEIIRPVAIREPGAGFLTSDIQPRLENAPGGFRVAENLFRCSPFIPHRRVRMAQPGGGGSPPSWCRARSSGTYT